MIRDVAYASLPRAERARLHERAAEGIRRRAGERYPELAELVTFHLLRANELGPTDARGQTAREASLEAAEIAARRGATARAQELYEQSAALAGSDRERAEALDAAAGVALQRWRGDESLRLLREMAETAERGGEARLAAGAYARAVEVVSRMGGITGDLPEEELQAMLDRGRALVPDDDKVTRARLLLDEAWMSWRISCNEEMAGPARAGLELARQTEDIPVLSSALDAVAALAWTEGKYGLAVEHARERLELLAGVRGRAHAIEVERSDALHMMIESLVATGDFRQASQTRIRRESWTCRAAGSSRDGHATCFRPSSSGSGIGRWRWRGVFATRGRPRTTHRSTRWRPRAARGAPSSAIGGTRPARRIGSASRGASLPARAGSWAACT